MQKYQIFSQICHNFKNFKIVVKIVRNFCKNIVKYKYKIVLLSKNSTYMEVCMADMNNDNNNFSNNGMANNPPTNSGNMPSQQGQMNGASNNQQQNSQFSGQSQNTNLQNNSNNYQSNSYQQGQQNNQFSQNPINPPRPQNPQFSSYQQNPQYSQQYQQTAQSQQQTSQNQVNQNQAPSQQNPNSQNNAPQQPNQQQPQQQAPQGASAGYEKKKTLSEEDKERLSNFNYSNDEIKKLRKRKKKAELTENARPLTKVRRLYSARIAHRVYPEQMQEINRLRALAEEGGKKGAALIGSAARKTRNLVASILLVLAILAIVGTGTLVTILMLNNEGNSVPSGTIEFTDNTDIKQTITGYRMGEEIDEPITIANLTNRDLYFLFYVTISAPTDAPLTEGLDFKDLEIEFLGVQSENWFKGTNNGITYYTTRTKTPMFKNESITDNKIQIITGYKINVKDGVDENAWANKTVVLTFNIIGCESSDDINNEISKIGVTLPEE